MNDVRLPIETTREGEKITKVCVEDVYKIINRVQEAMDKAYNNSADILNSIEKTHYSDSPEPNTVTTGYLIIGNGTSEPCNGDVFNEETGNDIAFMKAKLNANIKKHNFLVRIWNEYIKFTDKLDEEISKIDSNITRDLAGVRQYNPDYLIDIEYKLGIFD